MSETDAAPTPECPLPPEIFVPRDEIQPNDYNPNYMDQDRTEQLVQSIVDNTWTQPIVLNEETGVIIDGEQRWKAAADPRVRDNEAVTPESVPAGHIPVVAIAHDEGDARISTLQHNTRGEMDYLQLGEVMADLDAMEMAEEAKERLGFSAEEMDRLVEDVTAPEAVGGDVEDFSVPWEPVERTEVDEDDFEEEHRSESVRDAEAGSEGAEDLDGDGSGSDGAQDRDVSGGTETGPASVDPSDYQRISFVVSSSERELMETALGDEQMAQTMINLCQFAIDTEILPEVRPDLNADAAAELADEDLEELTEEAKQQAEQVDVEADGGEDEDEREDDDG